MQEFEVLEYSQLSLLNADFSEHVSKETVPALWGASMENVTGNYIFESKDVSEGFDIKGAESIYYCKGFFYGKNCWDSDFTYYNDECHELISSTHSSLLRFCFAIFNYVPRCTTFNALSTNDLSSAATIATLSGSGFVS